LPRAPRRRNAFAVEAGNAARHQWHVPCNTQDRRRFMEAPNQSDKPFVIVVGVDYMPTGDLAVARAFELASLQPAAEVHVVNVARAYGPMVHVDLPQDIRTLSADEAAEELRKYVERQVDAFRRTREGRGPGGFRRAVAHLRLDAPAQAIAQLASDLEADLVVVGTHGRRGFSRVMLGSVAEGVVRMAPCAVLVVRPKEEDAAAVPKIEPACPECVATRKRSSGQELWCAQHSERHGRRHTYHYLDRNVESRPMTGLLTEVS
jgi:nucleotide-binding universal stress UspA family protein